MRTSLPFLMTGLMATTCLGEPVGVPPHPPEPLREFRGVWVATVDNINWPSKRGMSVAAQKAELIALLDAAQSLNLNAVFLQVRPACDALYKSDLEPWSEYLTGTMGRAPEPAYDPLQYAVDTAHRRGLELHAWINPFRAQHQSAASPVAPSHISKKRPDLVHRYGNLLWLDPGEPVARDHSLKVILDIVRRYDIDGIHFDDYFYPYPEKDARGGHLAFPDAAAWKKYGRGLPRSNWRRKNVDDFIQQVQKSVHAEKPWVQFGISPFGIWRPGHPEQIAGLDAYEALYADARKWLRQGWVDYMIPQLYWSIDSRRQSFPMLLKWWEDQNLKRRHLWPGLAVFKMSEPWRWQDTEILQQVALTRKEGLNGEAYYQIGVLIENPSLIKALKTGPYSNPALTPALPWLNATSPSQPTVDLVKGNQHRVKWTPGNEGTVKMWVFQTNLKDTWSTSLLPSVTREVTVTDGDASAVSLRAVDRFGNLSNPVILPITQ